MRQPTTSTYRVNLGRLRSTKISVNSLHDCREIARIAAPPKVSRRKATHAETFPPPLMKGVSELVAGGVEEEEVSV